MNIPFTPEQFFIATQRCGHLALPCPTAIFTFGMLLLAAQLLPWSLFLVPVLWAVVGSIGAFRLGVLQDLGLLAAGLIGVAVDLYLWRKQR